MFTFSLVSAEVGLGISPSKMREHLVAGSSYEYDIIVFNVGTEGMDINLVANGEIEPFTTITPASQFVEPEPVPHEFPIKNGKIFHVSFDVPNGRNEVVYSGSFSAIGKGEGDTQFGGNVAVVSKVELNVVPSASFFSSLNSTYIYLAGAVLLLFLIIFGLKKAGLRIEFGSSQSNVKPKKSKKKTRK